MSNIKIPDEFIHYKQWVFFRQGDSFSVNVYVRDIPQYPHNLPCSKTFVYEIIRMRHSVLDELVELCRTSISYSDSRQGRQRYITIIDSYHKEKQDLNGFVNHDSLVRKVEQTPVDPKVQEQKRKSIIDNVMEKLYEHKNRS